MQQSYYTQAVGQAQFPEPAYAGAGQAEFPEPPYAGAGSYYQVLPEQLTYPNQQGPAWGAGAVSTREPLWGTGQEPGAQNPGALGTAWTALSIAGAAGGMYHGWRRNQKVGWALWWGLMGGLVPVLVLPLALAQGFGRPRRAV